MNTGHGERKTIDAEVEASNACKDAGGCAGETTSLRLAGHFAGVSQVSTSACDASSFFTKERPEGKGGILRVRGPARRASSRPSAASSEAHVKAPSLARHFSRCHYRERRFFRGGPSFLCSVVTKHPGRQCWRDRVVRGGPLTHGLTRPEHLESTGTLGSSRARALPFKKCV